MITKRSKNNSWTLEEKRTFDSLTSILGKDYMKYIQYLPNKSYNQIKGRYHNQEKQRLNQLIEDPINEKKRKKSKTMSQNAQKQNEKQQHSQKLKFEPEEMNKIIQLVQSTDEE